MHRLRRPRRHTNRAWAGRSDDPSRVYDATDGGCHRSEASEVRGAVRIASRLLTLGCCGANVLRGRQPYRDEAPRADQPAAAAPASDVELIALPLGGNDLGFADVFTACATDHIVWYSSRRQPVHRRDASGDDHRRIRLL
ncbi:hypothetical protein PUR59_11150 [Streptomyces sp. SP18ES09]|uniref:hypothetical protein n=1 Tax=Streptomyces sp. SP18ES09 TaxID=3002532 RepID=UPI002E79DDDC|nr:hypothetical protein [Streptomyces sp. SP18ES09]MEE1815564.1 hypothetical protein [Streptomyces sp. SP18ES09]